MWRLDHAHTGRALLIDDLIAKSLHACPMHFRPEMMLSVVTVIKPDPIVELIVTAHAPGDRFVGVSAVVAIVAVQIRKAVTEVPKEEKKTDVVPVQNSEGYERAEEKDELGDTPKSFSPVLAFQLQENGLGILAKETEESVLKWVLGLTIMTVFVNGKPIDRLAFVIRPVRITFVMLHVNTFIKDLTKADGDRFEYAEETIEQRRTKIRIMNEVVRDAVDVPRDANRVDETEEEHDPKRRARKQEEHPEEIGAVQKRSADWDYIPAGVGKNFGIGFQSLSRDIV